MAFVKNGSLAQDNRLGTRKVIEIENINGDRILMTPLELKASVKECIDKEFKDLISQHQYEKKLMDAYKKRLEEIEERLMYFIEAQYLKVAEKVADLMIQRQFGEEVDKRVRQKLQSRGKF